MFCGWQKRGVLWVQKRRRMRRSKGKTSDGRQKKTKIRNHLKLIFFFCFVVVLKAGLSRYPCETPGSESLCYRTSHEDFLANKRWISSWIQLPVHGIRYRWEGETKCIFKSGLIWFWAWWVRVWIRKWIQWLVSFGWGCCRNQHLQFWCGTRLWWWIYTFFFPSSFGFVGKNFVLSKFFCCCIFFCLCLFE